MAPAVERRRLTVDPLAGWIKASWSGMSGEGSASTSEPCGGSAPLEGVPGPETGKAGAYSVSGGGRRKQLGPAYVSREGGDGRLWDICGERRGGGASTYPF